MSPQRWTRVGWKDLADYPGETSRLYGGPLGIEHFGVLINRQPAGRRGAHHAHSAPTEEIYLLLRGRGHLWIGDELIEMEPLDAVRIPSPIPHSTENRSSEEIWWMVLGAPNDEYIAADPLAYTPIDTSRSDEGP